MEPQARKALVQSAHRTCGPRLWLEAHATRMGRRCLCLEARHQRLLVAEIAAHQTRAYGRGLGDLSQGGL